ncbi:MAG: hypothetical protein PVG53_09390, partial [Holophagae bacterium]
SPEVGHFPGSFFDTRAKQPLQRRAMESWPGPAQLVERWRTGELNRKEQMAVLLGASASHDPQLLPVYRDAIESDDARLRMAAAYGYRELIADGLLMVAGGVGDADARALAGEMDAVAATLRERPLVELWLQAALANEGASMPGWRGVVLKRPVGLCLRALEEIVIFDDVELLATAYRSARGRDLRLGLVELLEAVTLQRFFFKPKDPSRGWGMRQVNEAFDATDAYLEDWLDRRCVTDPGVLLSSSLAALGVPGIDPWSPEAYVVWQQVLVKGPPPWQMMAARRLYEYGGRWQPLPASRAESPAGTEARRQLIDWYRLRPGQRIDRAAGTSTFGD